MQRPAKALSSDAHSKKAPLRDCLGKSYALERSEQYEQFLKELGVKKNTRHRALHAKPRVALFKQQDDYFLTTSYPEVKDVTVKFRIGEAVQRRRPGGAVATSVFYLAENNLREEQQVDNHTVVIERMFTKRDLTVTMEVNDVKCLRYYTLSTSKHSIGTETSRRSSLWKTSTSKETETTPELESVLENIMMPETESEEDVCY